MHVLSTKPARPMPWLLTVPSMLYCSSLRPGLELAFNVGMAGWVMRLGLLTVRQRGGAHLPARRCGAKVEKRRWCLRHLLWAHLSSAPNRKPCPLPLLLQLLPLFPSLWLVLPVDLLQGVTFGVGEQGWNGLVVDLTVTCKQTLCLCAQALHAC